MPPTAAKRPGWGSFLSTPKTWIQLNYPPVLGVGTPANESSSQTMESLYRKPALSAYTGNSNTGPTGTKN